QDPAEVKNLLRVKFHLLIFFANADHRGPTSATRGRPRLADRRRAADTVERVVGPSALGPVTNASRGLIAGEHEVRSSVSTGPIFSSPKAAVPRPAYRTVPSARRAYRRCQALAVCAHR